MALGGGMAVQEAVAPKWKQVTGVTLVEAYGLTETSPAATINPLDIADYNGSIGLPIPSTEVTLRDDAGKDVPLGEPGEICIKGPQVMAGYWQRPDETAKVMTPDGFFATGDIGVMDDRGFVRIVDRKKDMILVSGFNVYPNEIEGVVATHAGRARVRGDRRAGREVGRGGASFYVVKKDAALTAGDVMKHCRDHLTGYKCPRDVEFRDELPKSNVGKILRRELRDERARQAGLTPMDARSSCPSASRCCASCRCRPTSTSTATSSAAGSCRRSTSPAACWPRAARAAASRRSRSTRSRSSSRCWSATSSRSTARSRASAARRSPSTSRCTRSAIRATS